MSTEMLDETSQSDTSVSKHPPFKQFYCKYMYYVQ